MPTQAGDPQRQVPPLSQSRLRPLGSAVRPRQGARPAGEESRDSQGKTGAQVSFRRITLEQRELYLCARNHTPNTP